MLYDQCPDLVNFGVSHWLLQPTGAYLLAITSAGSKQTYLIVKQIPTQALFLGQKLIWLPQCQSTNAEAMDLVRKGQAIEGLVVGTDHQTAGRGQRGNTWESEQGQNLTVSCVLRPQHLPLGQQFALSMAMANGVRAALAQLTSHAVMVKWPNDIYIHQRKIGGLLLESIVQAGKLSAMVVGLGLNINQLDGLPPQATSLRMLTGSQHALDKVLGLICHKVEQEYLSLRQANGIAAIKQRYMAHLLGYGQLRNYRITLTGEHFSAMLVDVLQSGRAVFRESDGQNRSYDIKEVEWLW